MSSIIITHISRQHDVLILNDCRLRGINFKPGYYFAVKDQSTFFFVKCQTILLQKIEAVANYTILGYKQNVSGYVNNELMFKIEPTNELVRFGVEDLYYVDHLIIDSDSTSNQILNNFYFECLENKFAFSL